jgi:subtilisin family serine protease
MLRRLFIIIAIAVLAGILVFFVADRLQPAAPSNTAIGTEPLRKSRARQPGPAVSAELLESADSAKAETKVDPAAADSVSDAAANDFVVSFERAAELSSFVARLEDGNGEVLGTLDNWHTVRVRMGRLTLDALLDDLGAGALEVNHIVRTPKPLEQLPNPPLPGQYQGFGRQALNWLGASTDNSEWGVGVLVAILDTAVDLQHPALAGLAISQINLVSDEADDGLGSYSGHGTAVASIIAGTEQVKGIAPAVELLSVGVLGSYGEGDVFTVAQGIVAAVDEGADIINLSLGAPGGSRLLAQAVAYAHENGVMIVAAAGNDGIGAVNYPAQYEEVLAVTAVDATGKYVHFSNYGHAVDIAAPGIGIAAAWGEDDVISFSGTSAAVPFVSGTLAALLAQSPGATAEDLELILLDYTNDAGLPNADPYYGEGVLNIGRILARDEPGIHNMSISSHYLDVGHDDPNIVTVVVAAENRGTQIANHVVLDVKVGTTERRYEFDEVEVGASVSRTVNFDATEVNEFGAVQLWTEVRESGREDASPTDNTYMSVLRVDLEPVEN